METTVNTEILEEDQVSTANTQPKVIAQSSSSIEDSRLPKQPKTQHAPTLIQPLKVLGLPRHAELLKPKIENYSRKALPVSYQVPPLQATELWRSGVEGCHKAAMPVSSHRPMQTPQIMKPRVQGYYGGIVPFETELSRPKKKCGTPTLIDTLQREESMRMIPPLVPTAAISDTKGAQSSSKNFWKAGDYDGQPAELSVFSFTDMDHVRVHPMFLHSNATSHKWAIGAMAELLDNAMDERKHGATFVNIDILVNKKDGSQMLLVEDNGGGMDPNRLRQCMSLGFSVKRKSTDTIGQYGNGFKTSTMRLGADVIVFTRCAGIEGISPPTQSIGLLSYTFLLNCRFFAWKI